MKVVTTINGGIKVTLEKENSDDALILELIKNKTVAKITVNAAGDGDLTGVNFELKSGA